MFAEDTGLYFYSAWLQADAAIFAIVFIFFIYKLQSIENNISSSLSIIYSQGSKEYIITAFNIIKTTDDRSGQIKESTRPYFKEILENLVEALDFKDKVPIIFKPIFIILPMVLMVSSILLLSSNELHSCGTYIEMSGFGTLLIIQAFSIYYMLNIIRKLIYN